MWSRLIAGLKAQGKIKATGGGRKTSYVLMGASTPVAKQPKAKKAQKTEAKAAKGKGRGAPTFSDSDAAAVLALITAKPGQAPSVYRAASKLNPKVFKNLLLKLKSEKRVMVGGVGKGTTYSVA